jgi:signal peptidase I
MTPKSRATAIVLSLVVPGLGHAYLGVLGRALLFLALNPLLAVAVGIAAPEGTRGVMIGTLVLCIGVVRVAAAGDTLLVPPERHRSRGAGVLVGLVVLGLVLAQGTAFALRAQVMEAFKVPAGSMMPTLLVGDHFFTDKIVYRKRDPRRGEVIVFKYPEHPAQDFVKRVAGISGDTIAVRNGALIINDWEVPRCKVGTWSYADVVDGASHRGDLYVEFLEDSAYYVLLDEQTFFDGYQGPYTVKEGESFVLGDNRNNSHDSRMWWGGTGGGVPRANLRGRARVLWLSPAPGRTGADLGELGPPPSPDLA